jgi:heterotetrameric sarcosine oxidase gamma subunit|tara:strand:- start:356 stop:1042 length:687 start_codon:yes stop_codon:yes gene_type:complete
VLKILQENNVIKTSPLSGIYRNHPVKLTEVSGWEIAKNFGNDERELIHLSQESVLVDWSHIGKISFSGGDAAKAAEQVFSGASEIEPLKSSSNQDMAVLCLTRNDYLILCQSGMETALLGKIDHKITTVTNQTGSQGCLVLGGPRRDEVLQRSTAMDLRRDRVVAGSVIQSSIHTVGMTLYRTKNFDIMVHPRNLSESLYDALIDVGIGVGLVPCGISTVPVSFEEGK